MKLIILDRDGVINHDSDDFIESPDEWQPIAGSLEAIALLNQGGYRVVIATNQSAVGRGLLNIESLLQIHDKMRSELAAVGGHVDAIFYCPHRPEDDCDCRKPQPGMLLKIGTRLRVPLAGVPIVGDSTRDLEAAERVGAQPVLVLTGKGRQTLEGPGDWRRISVYDDLADVAKALLSGKALG